MYYQLDRTNKTVFRTLHSQLKILHEFLWLPLLLLGLTTATFAYAATSPDLGLAKTFGILASTYTNTAGGTVINGDLGYTTPPAVAPTVNGTTHVANSTYNQAGIDQGTALTALNNQACSFTFAPGAVDLATDTTHGPVGVYTSGVYCITGAASIGGGGTITLTGSGTYIFRMDGALTTSANSVVALAGGASSCNVWWTPTAATTLGANSTFKGTDIDNAGITIGSTVNWEGRALAFGGTVSTDTDTITVPTCATSATTPSPSTLSTTSATPAASGASPGLPNTGLGSNSKISLLSLGILASLFWFYRTRHNRAG